MCADVASVLTSLAVVMGVTLCSGLSRAAVAVTRCCLQQFAPVHGCGCGLLLAIISAHAALLVTSPVCLGERVVFILYSVGVQAMHETNLRPSLHPLPEGAWVVGGCSRPAHRRVHRCVAAVGPGMGWHMLCSLVGT